MNTNVHVPYVKGGHEYQGRTLVSGKGWVMFCIPNAFREEILDPQCLLVPGSG